MNHGEGNIQSNVAAFVLGAVLNLMAVVDWISLADYALKALVGGMIWLVFKVMGDIVVDNIREDKKRQEEEKKEREGNKDHFHHE